MKLLYIGYITGPFGLKGEVKILSETNHKNDIFKVGNSLYIDNKKYINFGNKEYIKNLSQKLSNKGITYHVCDYGSANAHTCMGNCKACLHCDTVLFNQH